MSGQSGRTCTAVRHGSAYAYSSHQCRCPDALADKTRLNKQHTLRVLRGLAGLIDATGTRRRVQALHAIGWRAQDLAARLGVDAAAVRQLKWRPTVQATTARTIAALYDALADEPGPSALLATKAAGWGWLPPLWWDDDTIDDPTAQPTRHVRQSRQEALAEDAQWLLEQGYPRHAVAARIGITADYLDTVLIRAGAA